VENSRQDDGRQIAEVETAEQQANF